MTNNTLHHWITLREGDGYGVFDVDWRLDTIDEKGETVEAVYVDGASCDSYREAEQIFYSFIKDHPDSSHENEISGVKKIRV